QPLFQGGRLLANSRRAKAVAEAALLQYAETALEAYKEAEDAIAAEQYLAEREDALKLAYQEAADAENLTERRYESGAATIFNLLDAQTRRIQAESSFIDATRQRLSNRVGLYLAIGGDFAADGPSNSTDAAATSEDEGPTPPADDKSGPALP
ncbi:MAG TPA: TolC family protein, partial [Parvularculaceae bacterium]|nr:TolC family protein [Parvularculaceae bacterium]